MTVLLATIPVSIFLGLLGLAAFLWSLRRGQYRDLEGDAARILLADDDAPPPRPEPKAPGRGASDDDERGAKPD